MGLLDILMQEKLREQRQAQGQQVAEGLLGTAPTQQQIMPVGGRMSVQIGTKSPGEGYLGSQKGFEDRAKLMTGLLGAGYSSADAKSLLDQATAAAVDPTAQQQNFAAYQAMAPDQRGLYEKFRQSGATSINMITPPTGYTLIDPNDPSRGAIPIPGGPATKPTAAESKSIAQAEMSQRMLGEIGTAMQSGIDVSSPALWAESEMATMPMISWMTNLSPNEASLASNLRTFENQFLAMMRGAQVGPKEQIMFRKQLPQIGQSPELFAENFENSQKNLRTMINSISRTRQFGDVGVEANQPPPLPAGFVPVP